MVQETLEDTSYVSSEESDVEEENVTFDLFHFKRNNLPDLIQSVK